MPTYTVQEKLSMAYLQAIIAKADFAMQENNRHVDNIGWDVTIFNKPTQEEFNQYNAEIFAQVKSVMQDSETMFEESESTITYTLSKKYQSTPNRYLFVFVLPPNTTQDEWCKISKSELILKRCMYYIKMPAKAGKVVISKDNVLTPESISTLFLTSEITAEEF